MPLCHEGKKNGSSPLKGEIGMTCFHKPAVITEKHPERLSFTQTPHSGHGPAIPDTKRLQEENVY